MATPTSLRVRGSRMRQSSELAKHYDEADVAELAISRAGIGFASLSCERGFQGLRWVISIRHRNYGYRARLIDRTDGNPVSVEFFSVERPLAGEAQPADTGFVGSPLGGMLWATNGEQVAGAKDDRPGLAALLDYVREGDTVVVWKLDRLGRNTLHILETVKALTDRRVTLVSTTDGIDSSTAAGRMMIGVLGSLAEYERELVRERTALKRATSRANGTRFGRPKKVGTAEHIATAKRMRDDGHTGKAIAKYLGVSRATLYRYLAAEAA